MHWNLTGKPAPLGATADSNRRLCRYRCQERKGRQPSSIRMRVSAVTAGNAPGLNDAAAAVILMSAEKADALGLAPLVRIKAQAQSGVAPRWVMLAPVIGVKNVLRKAGWSRDEVDLYELNEAFSVQALGVARELELDITKVNVNGGAVAIGHPIGASGARILVTLIHEMIRRDAKKGVAALCLGGGNSVALAIER
jgi:acetyl-CoA C-acetyltransferase